MDIKQFPKSPGICNCTNMRRASRAITQFYDKFLMPSGLKVTQYSLLNHLKRLGPLTMNELSQAIRLERTTLVRNLKPQTNQVNITESGLQALTKALPYWTQAQAAIDSLFSDEERKIFGGALEKIESIVP